MQLRYDPVNPGVLKIKQYPTMHANVNSKLGIDCCLTSIPSLLIIELSILMTAVFIVLGGGSLVRPMFIALDLLESNTVIYLLAPSAAF